MSRGSRFQKLVSSASGDMTAGEIGFISTAEALQILEAALGVNFGANATSWMKWFEAQSDKESVEKRCIAAWKMTFANTPTPEISPEEILRMMKEVEQEAVRKSKQSNQ